MRPSISSRAASRSTSLPLETFYGPAVVADLRHRMPGGGITGGDLEQSAGQDLQKGDRLLLRTDCNVDYDGSMEWQKRSPYLTNDAIDWCLERSVPVVGFDMYHGADAPELQGGLQHLVAVPDGRRRHHAVPEKSRRHRAKSA